MYIPVTEDLDSIVYETQVRLFHKDVSSKNAVALNERTLKLIMTSPKHEASIFYTDPKLITEIPIRLMLKHKSNDSILFFIGPTNTLNEGQLMISSQSWLRNKIFLINLPEDIYLNRGLEVVICCPDAHECTTISYKSPIASLLNDSTTQLDRAIAQIRIRAYTGPFNITKPEIIEITIGHNTDYLLYKPLVGFPKVTCGMVDVTTQPTHQISTSNEQSSVALNVCQSQKSAQRIGWNSCSGFNRQHNNSISTILQRKNYTVKDDDDAKYK